MPSLKSSLVTVGFIALLGTAAVVGCSASGDGGGDTSTTNPTTPDNTASLPPPSNPGSSGDTPPPPAKTDGGKTDAGKDAGPPPPNPGDPCTKADSTASKDCGACGKQQAICQNASGADGGALTWSDYGVCQGELAGGCTPGTTEACGNCGTHTCSKYCGWDSCKEPAGACAPGATDYSAAGCTTPSTYRKRDCSTTCTWSSYSTTCAAPVNDVVLNIPTATTQTASTTVTLSTAKQGNRVSAFGTCPLTTADISTGSYPYKYVEIKNTSAKAATVTIYTSQAAGGPLIDTVLVGYATPLQPMDDNGLVACAYGPDDQCSSDLALCGDANFSILKAVPIAAGASILVNVLSYYESSSTSSTTTGPVKLSVRTDTLM